MWVPSGTVPGAKLPVAVVSSIVDFYIAVHATDIDVHIVDLWW